MFNSYPVKLKIRSTKKSCHIKEKEPIRERSPVVIKELISLLELIKAEKRDDKIYQKRRIMSKH